MWTLLPLALLAPGQAAAQTQVFWEIVSVTTSLGSPIDQLAPGETVTIGARVSNPAGESIVEMVGAFDGYDDSILEFVSGARVDGLLYDVCTETFCFGGLPNLLSDPVTENAFPPYVQVLGGASTSAATGTGDTDPGLDGVVGGGGAQFEVTFEAIDFGVTTVVVGTNPTFTGPNSVGFSDFSQDEALTDSVEIRVGFFPPAPVPSVHPIALYTAVPLLMVGTGLWAMRSRGR